MTRAFYHSVSLASDGLLNQVEDLLQGAPNVGNGARKRRLQGSANFRQQHKPEGKNKTNVQKLTLPVNPLNF